MRTELTDDDIEDEADGTASFLVDVPNGGALVMRNNVLEKGARTSNSSAAVVIGEEGVVQPSPELLISGNRFTNDQPRRTTFVRPSHLDREYARRAGRGAGRHRIGAVSAAA
jgi:hypothetical protein